MTAIAYKDGYRYQLQQDLTCSTPIRPPALIHTRFIELTADGQLTLRAGYAWDGPSGPVFHTRSFMRPSLIHDAFCQLIGEGYLSPAHQRAADQLLFTHCRADGMNSLRAAYVYLAVRLFRGPLARVQPDNPVRHAP
jgi:hypothetical protein